MSRQSKSPIGSQRRSARSRDGCHCRRRNVVVCRKKQKHCLPGELVAGDCWIALSLAQLNGLILCGRVGKHSDKLAIELVTIALRKDVRTDFEGSIHTITNVFKFTPSLPHPILQHEPPMLNLVQVWRVGRQIPNLTSYCCNDFFDCLTMMETGIVNSQ